MTSIILEDILNKKIVVEIQYIDTDKSTVLHEKTFSGRVVKVDPENGISIQPDEDQSAIAVIPPSVVSCSRDGSDGFHIGWRVYRVQENRTDGEHEWWDWQPESR